MVSPANYCGEENKGSFFTCVLHNIETRQPSIQSIQTVML